MSAVDLNLIVQEMLVEQRERVRRGEGSSSVPSEKLEDTVTDQTTLTSSMKPKKKRKPVEAQEDFEGDSDTVSQSDDEEYEEWIVEQAEFSEDERKALAKVGKALPDGSFPIRNAGDLGNAIKAYGRGKNHSAAKAHIKKRAKALGKTGMLPDEWSQESDDVTQSGGFLSGFVNWLHDLYSLEAVGPITQDLGIPGNPESPVQPEVGVTNPSQVTKRKKPRKGPKKIGEEDPEDLFEAEQHNNVKVTQEIPILQVDQMKRIVTGVVQTPDVEVRPASMPKTILVYPKSTVAQMAYDFMKAYHNGQIGVRHTEVNQGKIADLNGENGTVVESYIAPIDMEFPDGRTVVQGSWVMSVQINNDQAWQDVLSGQLAAFSLASTDVDFTDL